MLKEMEEHMFTMKREVVGRSSAVSDDLVQSVDQKICENGASQFHNSRMDFHKFRALLSTALS
jgi:hypothetical protein